MKYCYTASPNYTLNSTSRYFVPPSSLFLPLSTSIGNFSGCCKKVYPFSACRLRLPLSVSFYKSRNPILESTSDYAATCASLRIDIIYATTEMRDERSMKSSHLPRWFHTFSPLPTPQSKGFRSPAKRSVLLCKFQETISSPVTRPELPGLFSNSSFKHARFLLVTSVSFIKADPDYYN